MKKLSSLFFGFAILLSHVMCAVVAYHYGCLISNPSYSAPAYVAFFFAIPFLIAIGICILTAFLLKKASGAR